MEDMEYLVINPLESILIGGPSKCTYVSSLLNEEEGHDCSKYYKLKSMYSPGPIQI